MTDHFTHFAPLAAGQTVAVFPHEDVSGATIGYHGIVLGLSPDSYHNSPATPNRWLYEVLAGRQKFLVAGCQLVPLGTILPRGFDEPSHRPALELHFENDPDGEPNQLRGAYRLLDGEAGCFIFRRWPQSHASYQWRLPTPHATVAGGLLEYEVPAEHQLNRAYVWRAFVEILRGSGPMGPPPADSKP